MTQDARGRVVILGQGYVGLPVSMRAVEVGYDVVGFDVAKDRVERLRGGQTFIDDISDAEIAAALATGRFTPSYDPADMTGFDVAVISVPTPLRDGAPDLSYIEKASDSIGPYVRPGCWRHPGVHHLSGHHRGGRGPGWRRSAGCAPAPTSTSGSPRSGSTRATRCTA